MQLFKKQETFSEFIAAFLKFTLNVKFFLKKDDPHCLCVSKVQTAKALVRPMSKKRLFRTPVKSQHVKGSQTYVKAAWQQFYYILSSLWKKLTWKTALLVICEIVGHFVNTLTANGKYYLHNSEILRQAFRMELSKKLLTFLEFYAPFLKSISYFEFFEKKDDPHCLYISKFTECEKCG